MELNDRESDRTVDRADRLTTRVCEPTSHSTLTDRIPCKLASRLRWAFHGSRSSGSGSSMQSMECPPPCWCGFAGKWPDVVGILLTCRDGSIPLPIQADTNRKRKRGKDSSNPSERTPLVPKLQLGNPRLPANRCESLGSQAGAWEPGCGNRRVRRMLTKSCRLCFSITTVNSRLC